MRGKSIIGGAGSPGVVFEWRSVKRSKVLFILWRWRFELLRRASGSIGQSLTLIALLLEAALGASVRHFGAALTGTGVRAAGARLDVLVASSLADLSRLLVMILTGTGASAARLGPHVHFAYIRTIQLLGSLLLLSTISSRPRAYSSIDTRPACRRE